MISRPFLFYRTFLPAWLGLDDAVVLSFDNKTSDANFIRLAAGFGLFSRFTKFRTDDKLKQFEVLAAFNDVLNERGSIDFHVSGGGALNVLELLAYANVSSADGSSAVLAGLAYGSIVTDLGRSIGVNKLDEWSCNCDFCLNMGSNKALRRLQLSPEARVRHNICIVRRSEARINNALRENTIAELTERRLREYGKKELWKCYALITKHKARK